MIRATMPLNGAAAEWAPRVVARQLSLAGTGAKPTPTHGDDRSNDSRCGIVSGLLAKREDSHGVPTMAKGADGPSTTIFRDAAGTVLEFDFGDLVHTTVAVFRNHPHINNVMTHICGGQWERIGQALCVILNPLATLDDLSPLAQNMVELMCAGRGITGRILQPYFHAFLFKVIPGRTAAYLCAHILHLFREIEAHRRAPLSG